MKTLDQVESRTPISALPFPITSAGSFYLTKSLTGASAQHGITIQSDDVTLDLNGFALKGVSGSKDGIRIVDTGSYKNIAVRNGTVSGWGETGLYAGSARYVLISGLRVLSSGGSGILVGLDTMVNRCLVSDNGADGIRAGSSGSLVGCVVSDNYAYGIAVGPDTAVTGCRATGNKDGIQAGKGSIIRGCSAISNTGNGIEVTDDCYVVGNTCDNNGSAGITEFAFEATSTGNRIEANNVTDNAAGIVLPRTVSVIIRNTAQNNGSGANNYVIAAGNAVGQIVDVTSGGAISNLNPWANFEF